MTNLQKIALRLSEVRSRLNEISGLEGEAFTDEIRSESETLGNEFKDLETRHRAAIIGDDAEQRAAALEFSEGPEGAEMRALIDRCNVGNIFESAIEHRATDGAEKELQEHHNLGSNQIPLGLLETRATGVTPAPADVGANQSEIIPAVFPMACAAFLGVHMPTVAVGEAVFPVLSTSADAGTPDENATQDETAGAFDADLLSPARIQASFRFSREDRARFSGMSEALRMNLSEALSDKLDAEILAGDEGLLDGTNLANHNVSTETTFALYLTDFAYGRVDGKYASMTEDIRILMGSATFSHCGTAYRHQNADDLAIDRLKAITGGVKVSSHVPALAATKQNAIVRLGMRRDMVAPIWEGISLIPDEITKAADGQIVITAVMLFAVKILRAAGFYKQQIQNA